MKLSFLARFLILSAFCLISLFSELKAGHRVVSLLPSYTEIIFALNAGGDLVGVSGFCDWPPQAKKVNQAGDYLRPNTEKILSLKPDIVFSGVWSGSPAAKELQNAGLKVVQIPEEKNISDIYKTIDIIAAELNRNKEAEKLKKKLKAIFSVPVKQVSGPKVYLEVDAGGWTSGSQSFISDALTKAGGINIFADENKGYFQASWESVITRDPDCIVLLSGSVEDFTKRPLALKLKAVKNKCIINSLNRDAFTRPAPRLAEEIVKLRDLFNKRLN